jgi:hypothetical protein
MVSVDVVTMFWLIDPATRAFSVTISGLVMSKPRSSYISRIIVACVGVSPAVWFSRVST